MNAARSFRLFLAAAILLLAGCQVTPSSYEQWKQEQAERAKFEAAGIPYKSHSELRTEAGEMRRAAEEVTFKPAKKQD